MVWARALQVDDGADLVPVLRLAAVLLAATVATSVEDASELLATTSPFGRGRRRAVAVGLVTSAVVVTWATIAVVAGVVAGPGALRGDVMGGVAMELLALCACAWTVASATASGGQRGSGGRAALGLLLAALLSLGYPRTMVWLWPPLDAGRAWVDAHLRWIGVGVTASIAAAWIGRDPAGRWPWIGRAA